MYKEKEVLIFNALISLYGEGNEIPEITVSQIAKEAGIGKGTIYEYFSSKEDIVSNAIVYSFNSKLDDLKLLLSLEKPFEETVRMMFAAMAEIFRQKNPALMFIFNAVVLNKNKFLKGEDVEQLEEIRELGMGGLQKLYLRGVEEGVLKPCDDLSYLIISLRGVMLAFVSAFFCDEDKERVVDNAYTMLQKLFN